MGCAGSKRDDKTSQKTAARGSATFVQAQAQSGAELHRGALASEPNFEMSIPMEVMPYLHFKEQRRIYKSVAPWREEALKSGALIEYAWVTGGTGEVNEDGTLDGTLQTLPGNKIPLFVSHTWCARTVRCTERPTQASQEPCASRARRRWDRKFVDKTNDEKDPYDKGAPDYQTGENKDLKWRIICAGVDALIRDKGLCTEDVVLWMDWQVCARPPCPFVARACARV